MRPSRKVFILLFVLFGLVATTIGAYAGRSASTDKASAPARLSPGPTSAPADTSAEAAPADAPAEAATADAPTGTSAASQPAWPTGARVTAETDPVAYLVAVRTGRHA